MPTSIEHPPPQGGEGGRGDSVLFSYLDVMEQFLDVQREVMETYLAGRPAEPLPPVLFDGFADLPALLEAPPPALPEEPAAPLAPTSAPASYTLVGELVRYEPGHEVVVRRKLDLAEDRYVADHTIGGRNASQIDPDQHGLPVLPMTFSLEIMAECAALLLPGKCVVGLRDIRLFRWLPFDAEPTTIEATAVIGPSENGDGPERQTVQVTIRDLGAGAGGKATAQGMVLLADAFPEAPPIEPFALTNERPCWVSPEVLYRNLFHGPLFQGVRTTSRYGDEGIEGIVEVLPRSEWFRSTAEPNLLTDPVLIDAAMHLLGAWHLEQPDWTGRILLPFEVRKVEFFGPPPEVGGKLFCRGRNEEASARHFRHGVEIASPDGRLWCRLTGAGYWRFYLPFGHVNFFGPKDEYFLSRSLPEAVPGAPPAGRAAVGGRCMFLEVPADLLQQPVLRAAGARVTMTARELAEFDRIKAGPDADVNEWLFGRIVAKDAVRSLWTEKHGERMFPADIEIFWDRPARPVARPREGAPPAGSDRRPEALPPVCIAYADGRVAALSAFRPHTGIALVKAPPDTAEAEAVARCEAARRAVASALELRAEESANWEARASADGTGRVAVSLPPKLSARYAELSPGPLRVEVLRLGDFLLATTYCDPAA